VTQICKTFDKRFRNWTGTKFGHEFIASVGEDEDVIDIVMGTGKLRGTWVHPDIAIKCAEWIDAELGETISKWIHGIINSIDDISTKVMLALNKDGTLTLNNTIITCRSGDGKVNLTQLFKAGGKEYRFWYQNKKTKEFLRELQKICLTSQKNLPDGIPSGRFCAENPDDDFSSIITYEDHGRTDKATWCHPQVAIYAAQYISPEFAVQVTKWMFELAVTGKVELKKETTQEELEFKWKQTIEELQTKNKELEESTKKLHEKNKELVISTKELNKTVRKLTRTVNCSLRKHHYNKFDLNSPSYYVYATHMLDEDNKLVKVKHGIAGIRNENLDDRLQSHRTEDPDLQIKLVITSSESAIVWLESTMQKMFASSLIAPNHECFGPDLDIKVFIDRACGFIKMYSNDDGGKYNIIPQTKIIDFNNDIKSTLIKARIDETDINI
jgi:hypothetical protein